MRVAGIIISVGLIISGTVALAMCMANDPKHALIAVASAVGAVAAATASLKWGRS